MKKATLFIWLLCAVLTAHAQYETYKVNATTNEWEYMDVLTKGSEQDPASFKAIRLWSNDAKSFDLELIGSISVTQAQVEATLAKANYYYKVIPLGGQLRITAKDGVTIEQLYELVKTLLIGDYAYKFYMYTASTKRATP